VIIRFFQGELEMHSQFIRHAALLVLACVGLSAMAKPAAPEWKAELQDHGNRYLTWSATVPLMGKPTKINLAFQCNPKSEKDVHGTLGFDLYIHGIAALKPFAFDDFDGPDAKAGADGRKLMAVTVTRKDKPPIKFHFAPNGFTPHITNFGFGVADLSKLAKSESRSLLQALAGNDAETLMISITDPRNAKLSLQFTVPVAGRQAEFRTLMTGLK